MAPKAINLVYAASLGFHVVLGVLLESIHVAPPAEPVVVELTTIEEPKEEKPPPPKPVEEAPAPKAAPPRAAPVAKAAPPPTEAAPPPDFGLALSGGPSGPGGIAVPTAAPPPAAAPKQAPKKLVAAAAPAPEGGCEEPQVNAKATSMPHPAYTDDARAASIAGKVRVQLTIDPAGQVSVASVLEGLGHGLDEAAVAALRQASFNPATKCGKPVASTFVVAVRFAL